MNERGKPAALLDKAAITMKAEARKKFNREMEKIKVTEGLR